MLSLNWNALSLVFILRPYKQVKDLGMTLTEKWSTDNTLNTTVDVADKLLPGLKVSLCLQIILNCCCEIIWSE